MEQRSVEVLKLSSEETAALKEGPNLICKEAGNIFIIYKDPKNPEEPYKACRNICKHQGGTFVKDVEDSASSVLRCTKHGWKLDSATMKYVNPPDSFTQERLVPEMDGKGALTLVELTPPEPWKKDARPPWEIKPGEVKINADLRFMILMDGVHPDMDTCILVDYKARLASSFGQHRECYYRRRARAIYHLNFVTLACLDHEISKPEVLLQYHDKPPGHLILNTVDCTQPNGGRLPKNVDIMMSDFAGGASGFPMTFESFKGRYTEDWKAKFIATERKKLLYYKTQVVRDVNPKLYCPFAGYFLEAHPADKYILDTNTKNQADQLNALINKYSDRIRTWTPKPGGTLDLALLLQDSVNSGSAIVDPPVGTKIYKDSWDFDFYIEKIDESIESEIFAYPDWVQFYYEWAGFRDYNLVLRFQKKQIGDPNFCHFFPIPGAICKNS
ncbi:hypothetical protein Bbelb_025460 [Branchiostoma belcheri]|nr:hypothetical protein Bbelb_025460 [Branchiostoma belcheri]